MPPDAALERSAQGHSEALQLYRRLGYAQDEAVALGKRLIPDA